MVQLADASRLRAHRRGPGSLELESTLGILESPAPKFPRNFKGRRRHGAGFKSTLAHIL